MTRLHDTIKRARLRGTLNRMLHFGGVGLCIGIVAATLMLAVDRLVLGGTGMTWHMIVGASGIGLLAGTVWPLLKIPDAEQVALQIDRALHLKDRIASAHAMVSGTSPALEGRTGPVHDAGFAALVTRDAEKVTNMIDLRSVAPIRVTGVWGWAVALAVLASVSFVFLPSVAWGGESPTPEQAQLTAEQQEEREREREELLQSIEEAVAESEDAVVDERTREQLEALDRLAQQLQAEPGDEAEIQRIRDETAARLSELSQQFSEQSRKEQIASERLAERFSGMQTPETPMTADEFTEALRRGEFGRAADSLEDLLERRDELTPQQRRELAEHLHSMNDELDAASERDRQDLAERAAQLEQALRDQGLSQEDIEELLEGVEQSDHDIAEMLRDQQIDEDVARRLARELERLREQREIQDQVDRDSQSVNEALRDAADEFDPGFDQHEADPVDDTTPESEPRDEDTSDPSDDPADPTEPDEPADQPDDGDAAEQQQQESEAGEADESRQQREAAEETGGLQEDESREQAGEPGQQEAQQDQDADAQPGDSDVGEGEEVAQPSGDDGDETEAEAGEADPEGDQPGVGEGDGDDAPGAGDAEESQQRSPSDALRDMQQRRESSEQRRQSSERMRDRAQRMAGQQQADEADQPADADGATAGTTSTPLTEGEPGETWEREVEDLDLREEDFDAETGELIAEWMSDEDVVRDGDPTVRRSENQQRVRQAREIAERAVDDAAVPSRYHERIRRYFGRLNETVERAASGSTENDSDP